MLYTHFGYEFNQSIGGGKRHTGIDLNRGAPQSDRGLPIHSMADGVVVYSKNTGKGWGHLVVIHHPKHNVWTRYGHLGRRDIQEGEEVKEGRIIGTCGSTGGNWAPHLHFDVIHKELPRWTDYSLNTSKARVDEYYYDPLPYIDATNAQEDSDIYFLEEWQKIPWDKGMKKGILTDGSIPTDTVTKADLMVFFDRLGLLD